MTLDHQSALIVLKRPSFTLDSPHSVASSEMRALLQNSEVKLGKIRAVMFNCAQVHRIMFLRRFSVRSVYVIARP